MPSSLLTQLVYPAKTAPALWEALREMGEPLEELTELARALSRPRTARRRHLRHATPLRLRDGPALPGPARDQPPGRGAARRLSRGRALHQGGMPNFLGTFFGRGVYTSYDAMLFNAHLLATHFYR